MNPHIKKLQEVLVQELAQAQGRPTPKPGECSFCNKPGPFEFKDKISEKEHAITGICQECQDKVYSGAEA